MTAAESVDGPIYFGGAVVTDGIIQVAWIRPNMVIALRDPQAGWKALNHGFGPCSLVNRVIRAATEDQ